MAPKRDKEPAPLEAEVVNYRHPKRPTKPAVAEKPYAVIMLAWAPEIFGEDFDAPADRDFEGFTKLEHARRYYEIVVDWARNDWREHKDMRHAVILLDKTKSTELNISKMAVEGGDAKWRTAIRDGYADKPQAIYRKTVRDRVDDARALNRKPKVKRNDAAPKVRDNVKVVPSKAKKRPMKKRAPRSAAPKKVSN